MNRLAHETSPYLLQHAKNPVDWYPWGEEAFERARREDKPVLLSVGYSACHWCHVMERECFEDRAIAQLMNDRFVSVKVDREERPDVDQIYQLVVQLMGRGGGWPLTAFLTPDRHAFFAGTYFPPVPRHGLPSFPEVLRSVHDAFVTRRAELERGAHELTKEISSAISSVGEASAIPGDAARRASSKLAKRFDATHGGFGERPKFPSTMALDVMLRAAHDGDAESLERVILALDGMRRGGIHDQLGGGFHRYSTDAEWLVPHFEKMLYDNALLLRLYAEAFRATREPRFADTARGIVSYLERDMRAPDGLFYSAEDADGEGEEGRHFVWRPEELDALLTAEEARVARLALGVSEGGNFERTGASVLHEARSLDDVARELGLDAHEAARALERAKAKLLAARALRVRPARDDKRLATWNGLVMGALAEAGAALGELRYVELAQQALRAAERVFFAGPVLLRSSKDGEARIAGFLDDHADLACAALDVYEASFDEGALSFAKRLVEAAIARFWDEDPGAFRYAPREATDLVAVGRDAQDHSVPSGASSMAHALLRLGALIGEPRYEALAERVLAPLARSALTHPFGLAHAVCAMDRLARGATEIVIVARADDEGGEALAKVARTAWEPSRVLVRIEPDAGEGGLAVRLEGKRQKDGKATAYVCRERACSAPVTSPEQLAALLGPRRIER